MGIRNVFRQVRLDRIVELLFRGATWLEIAQDVGLTDRQVRRIRTTATFRDTYEKLRLVYGQTVRDFAPRRVRQLEEQREARVSAYNEVLSTWRRDAQHADQRS